MGTRLRLVFFGLRLRDLRDLVLVHSAIEEDVCGHVRIESRQADAAGRRARRLGRGCVKRVDRGVRVVAQVDRLLVPAAGV